MVMKKKELKILTILYSIYTLLYIVADNNILHNVAANYFPMPEVSSDSLRIAFKNVHCQC